MDGDNWTFWLNMMNLALGIVTMLALVVVFGAVVWELVARWVRKAREMHRIEAEQGAMLHSGSHSTSVPGLGRTMADGGERIEPSESQGPEEKPHRK